MKETDSTVSSKVDQYCTDTVLRNVLVGISSQHCTGAFFTMEKLSHGPQDSDVYVDRYIYWNSA